MPDIASTDPIRSDGMTDEEYLRKAADTNTRLQAPPQVTDDRADCPVCHGTGKTLTTADYLRELAAKLPTDPAQQDSFIAEFYRRLVGDNAAGVKGAAPHLREFFPADLTTGDAINSKGNRQRDQLLTAVVGLLTKYDPDHPDSDDMRYLAQAYVKWGNDHAWWRRPSDGSLYVPTAEDYLAVRNVLANLLNEAVGLSGREVAALVDAYEDAEVAMRYHAKQWRKTHGEPVVARRPRPEMAR